MYRWAALALLLLGPLVAAPACGNASCVFVPQVANDVVDASPPASPTTGPPPTAGPSPRPGPSSTAGPSPTATSGAPGPTIPSPTPGSTAMPTATSGPPASLNWTELAQMPIFRHESMGAVVGGKLFVFGGYTYPNNNWTPTRRGHAYDTATQRWTELPNQMPVGLSHAGIAVDGHDIYVVGGYPEKSGGGQAFATSGAWRFNVDDQQWHDVGVPLPEARGAGALVLLGRELHFLGGTTGASSTPALNRKDRGDHWALSLDGGTAWQPRAPLPTPRNHFGAVVLNGKIYAVGGDRGVDGPAQPQTVVEVYNPSTDSWAEADRLPAPRSHIAGATIVADGRILVIGGELDYLQEVNFVTVYDPETDGWTELTPLPEPRSSGVAGYIDGELYYASGANGSSTFTKTTYLGGFGSGGTQLVLQPAGIRNWLRLIANTFSPIILLVAAR